MGSTRLYDEDGDFVLYRNRPDWKDVTPLKQDRCLLLICKLDVIFATRNPFLVSLAFTLKELMDKCL